VRPLRDPKPLITAVLALAACVTPQIASAQRASGAGQQATTLFNLSGGLTVFELEHAGDGTFVVRLLDDRGSLIDTLVRVTGSFRGSKAIRIPHTGAYLYDVTASGTWTIALREPVPSPADTTVSAPLASSAGATANPVGAQAAIDAEQAARQKGASRWMLGGLAGGTLLGPVGAGLVYIAASRGERAPVTDVEARRAAHGDVYADAFERAYRAKRRSNRRVAALVGGATGTIVFGFVIAQIVNWSKESGGGDGPGGGELP
jgi:hypothetical protein